MQYLIGPQLWFSWLTRTTHKKHPMSPCNKGAWTVRYKYHLILTFPKFLMLEIVLKRGKEPRWWLRLQMQQWIANAETRYCALWMEELWLQISGQLTGKTLGTNMTPMIARKSGWRMREEVKPSAKWFQIRGRWYSRKEDAVSVSNRLLSCFSTDPG